MKNIRILKHLLISGKPVREGETVSVADSVATEMISRGVAVSEIAAPASEKEPEKEPDAANEPAGDESAPAPEPAPDQAPKRGKREK